MLTRRALLAGAGAWTLWTLSGLRVVLLAGSPGPRGRPWAKYGRFRALRPWRDAELEGPHPWAG